MSSKGVGFDRDLYGEQDKSEFLESIAASEDVEEEEDELQRAQARKVKAAQISGSRALIDETIAATGGALGEDDAALQARMRAEHGSGLVNTRIADREDAYKARRFNRSLDGIKEVDVKKLQDPAKYEEREEDEAAQTQGTANGDEVVAKAKAALAHKVAAVKAEAPLGRTSRRKRFSDAATTDVTEAMPPPAVAPSSSWDAPPGRKAEGTDAPSAWDQTPVASSSRGKSKWDETPVAAGAVGGGSNKWDETPASALTLTGRSKRSRWDETPVAATSRFGASDGAGAAPATPAQVAAHLAALGPAKLQQLRVAAEIDERNRPLTDAELDELLPATGYSIMPPPAGYEPPEIKRLDAPTPLSQTPGGFSILATPSQESYGIPDAPAEAGADLPAIKPEDMQYFGKLPDTKDDLSGLTKEELTQRTIMKLLLKVKSGTAPQRKTALRELRDNARVFGAEAIFSQILPLLMSPSLEDQERHLLVKCIDRVLYKLGELVRPFVHKILVVIEPLLIEEDHYARAEGREIISNLSKAAGLATMIATMRPDIDNPDEYVRNTTARAFAVVASALGISTILPFLRAVCQSKKSWYARHTGVKIVQQIATLMGCAVLPYMRHLVMMCAAGLNDEQHKVRTITALCMAALAEAAAPYGIEAFEDVLRPLWQGMKQHRGKTLAAFLKAIGFIIPLMDENYANHYTKEVMPVLIRNFDTPDEDMKKIVLKCVQQCVATDGVEPSYVKETVLPDFFRCFWIRRIALDRRGNRQVVETTVSVANTVGCAEILTRIVDDLKDDSEPYRRMVADCTQKVVENLGTADVDERLEERLLDGLLYAFQEQGSEETSALLQAFSTVVNSLGPRTKPYLPQISGTIKWRLNNKEPHVRMQSADLIAEIAGVMKVCKEEQLMGHLGIVLYEYLGEEYPEVLGSILRGLKGIVTVIGMTQMTPPIKDLLPRLTPILKNRHDKVQEATIELVGRIADRGPEFVPAKEWMRISVELLEMLKAPKKSIRRSSVQTFGYIAKAIGPQDVLHTLLNNLKVQERQMRVCTTVAIAIVAESCGPFTVLPALMNEYRIPDMNVQNGVLKAMSFMFEYIGSMNKDYVYAVAPLLEHALMDRDHVHRQTACTAVKHIALGVAGMGCEDVLIHLLNMVFPNVLEESPHVINACADAVEGLMVALGPQRLLLYLINGLWHPARFVRQIYWKMYNSLYIYSPEALVGAFPTLEDHEGYTCYTRSHLELMI